MSRTVESTFYRDPWVRSLKPPAKFLLLYLFTNEDSHVSGCYYITKETIAKDTGLSIDKIDTLYDTLYHRVYYDEDMKVVWVKNMLKYQGKGPRNQKAAAMQLMRLPEFKFIPEYLKHYPSVETYLSKEFLDRVYDRVYHRVSDSEPVIGIRTSSEEEVRVREDLREDKDIRLRKELGEGGMGETNTKPDDESELTEYDLKVKDYFDNISKTQMSKWEKACPNIDVNAEIDKAIAWLGAVQDKQKKQRFGSFTTNWLNNAEKDAKKAPGNQETAAERVKRFAGE